MTQVGSISNANPQQVNNINTGNGIKENDGIIPTGIRMNTTSRPAPTIRRS